MNIADQLAQAKRVSEWNHFTACEQQTRADKLERETWRLKRQRKMTIVVIGVALVIEIALLWVFVL